jgi:hypothetical protein
MPNKFFPPHTTTANRLAATPLAGEVLFDSDEKDLYLGDGLTPGGKPLTGGDGEGTGSPVWGTITGDLTNQTDLQQAINDAGAASWGDIGGTITDQTDLNQALVNASAPQSYATLTDVDTTGLAVGQTMFWNGTVWIPGYAVRELLTADRTYYVRTDGNDNNNGLSDSAGGAFLTIQKALDLVGTLDISIYNVTIQVADGTYTITSPLTSRTPVGAGVLTIRGNPTTPANVVISATGTAFILNGRVNLDGFRIISTGAGVQVGGKVSLVYIYNVQFGVCSKCIYTLSGGVCVILANLSLTANASTFFEAKEQSYIRIITGITITFTNTPTITTFALVYTMGLIGIDSAVTFSGATSGGKKYDVSLGGFISSAGTVFPGTTAGTTAAGGQYS